MNKKTLLIIFGAVALVIALFVTLAIDPSSVKLDLSLRQFHLNSARVYMDGLYRDDFIPKINEAIQNNEGNDEVIQKLENHKTRLNENIDKLSAIITKEIDPEKNSNLLQDVEKTSLSVLEEKTKNALVGIAKLIPIIDNIEKNMPEELKEAYNSIIMEDVTVEGKTTQVKKTNILKTLYKDTNKVLTSVGSKGVIKLILILLIVAASGITFIMIEKKARETGEIKASEIA